MKQRAASKGGRRPLQSRSAENLRPGPPAGAQKTGGHVAKSRSAQELVAEVQRERDAHSPPRETSRRRRQAAGPARREPAERRLSEEEREQVVESMHGEFCAKMKAVLNGLPPGSSEKVLALRSPSPAVTSVCSLPPRK